MQIKLINSRDRHHQINQHLNLNQILIKKEVSSLMEQKIQSNQQKLRRMKIRV